MTRRQRKLRPRERARQDQAAAAARNLGATDPTAAVFTMTYADPDTRCSWCDCPDTPDSPHYRPGYVCPGCPDAAAYVLHLLHGTPAQQNIPVCDRHRENLIATTAQWSQQMFGPIPVDLYRCSVLDDDR